MIEITGVGIGPGDPELITIKGLKALKDADVVYYPASKVDGDNITSFSLNILKHYQLTCELKPMLFPMKSKKRMEYYQQAYSEVKEVAKEGKKVVLVSEGDILFYSTFGYILRLANEDNITCRLIPGIPAFINAGAVGQHPLVEGDNKLVVIARPKSLDEISNKLEEGMSVVVMKMSVLDNWGDFLAKTKQKFLYVEKVGTPEQYITTDSEEISKRKIPYFSLIIFYAD